jgi:hypothetical protein
VIRSFIVCIFFICTASLLHAEQATIAELSKNLPEEKLQTINGRWIVKVRVPVQGSASTARKIAQSSAESIGKGKILEHACTPQRDGRLGKLNGVITELATNRVNIDSDSIEVIMSAPIQKLKCTFESTESKKNVNVSNTEPLNETKLVDSPPSTNQPSPPPESNKPLVKTYETGSDY